MSNVRKFIIILLLLITVALAGAGMYFGYRLSQEDVAPDDTSAGSWSIWGCLSLAQCQQGGTSITLTASPACSGMTGYLYHCPNGLTDNRCLEGDPAVLGLFSLGQSVDLVSILNSRGISPCGAVQFDWESTSYGPGQGSCGAVTMVNSTTICDTPISLEPSPTDSSRPTTTSTPPTTTSTPAPKPCGESCTSDDECMDYGTGGDRIACINGKCDNVLCPGNTTYGTICACEGVAVCGEICGYGAVGLCEDGLSSCRYLDSSCPVGANSPGNPITVCYPVMRETPGSEYYDAEFDAEWDSLGRGDGGDTYCRARDTNNSWIRNNYTGATNHTLEEIAALCVWCGNNQLDPGEQCDDGPLNGTAQSDCSENCDLMEPSPSPSITPSGDPTPSPSPEPSPSPSVSPSPSPTTPPTLTEPPDCGDSCTTDTDCANNYSCNPSTNRCAITFCMTNPDECSADMCSYISPQTAILEDNTSKIIVGILFVTLGIAIVIFGGEGYYDNFVFKKAGRVFIPILRNNFNEVYKRYFEKTVSDD